MSIILYTRYAGRMQDKLKSLPMPPLYLSYRELCQVLAKRIVKFFLHINKKECKCLSVYLRSLFTDTIPKRNEHCVNILLEGLCKTGKIS